MDCVSLIMNLTGLLQNGSKNSRIVILETHWLLAVQLLVFLNMEHFRYIGFLRLGCDTFRDCVSGHEIVINRLAEGENVLLGKVGVEPVVFIFARKNYRHAM